jgi:hypothetical protein
VAEAFDPYTHPTWCDPGRCTANPDADSPRESGAHLSAAITLDIDASMLSPYHPDRGPVTAWLSQAVTPTYRAGTFLRLHLDENLSLSLPQNQAGALLAVLGALADVAGADHPGAALSQTQAFERIERPTDAPHTRDLRTALVRRHRELLQRQWAGHVAAGDELLRRSVLDRIRELDPAGPDPVSREA